MRYPQATWRPGPDGKWWPETNQRLGAIMHSMEGSFPGALSQLDLGIPSWHFSVLQDGSVYQHYTLDRSCYHAGNRAGNASLIGIEHEGRAGEPLTEFQFQSSLALVRWLNTECNWQGLEGRLFEHRAWSLTECPSGRIPFERYTLPINAEFVVPEEEEVRVREMDQAQSIALIDVLNNTAGGWVADGSGRAQEITSEVPGVTSEGKRSFIVTVPADRVIGVG